jgi:hypothetical protein
MFLGLNNIVSCIVMVKCFVEGKRSTLRKLQPSSATLCDRALVSDLRQVVILSDYFSFF